MGEEGVVGAVVSKPRKRMTYGIIMKRLLSDDALWFHMMFLLLSGRTPSLISLMVSVDAKHHVYLLT